MTKLVETEIPDWAEWMAQDESGKWVVYEKEPVPYPLGWWLSPSGRATMCGHSGKRNYGWLDTLHKLEEK